MTKKERVLAQFKRQSFDYLPMQLNLADITREGQIASALGLNHKEDLQKYLDNHLAWSVCKDEMPAWYRNDDEKMLSLEAEGFVKLAPDGTAIYNRWGYGTLRGEDTLFYNYGFMMGDKEMDHQLRELLPENIQKLLGLPLKEQIRRLEIPDPHFNGNCDPYYIDRANITDDRYFIPSGYNGIYETAYAIRGWQNFMDDLGDEPMLMYELMEKVTEYRVQLAKEKGRVGFELVHHGDDLGWQYAAFFSPKMFREIFLPHYKRLFEEYKKNGQFIMMHSCGYVIDYLPDLIEIGLDGFEPCQPCNDLARLKREFGQDLVFMGGIDTQKLPFLTEQETRDMTRDVITTLGKGGGYIIAPSQELTRDVPVENIAAIIETAKEYRDKVD